jgi:hypothetical protein
MGSIYTLTNVRHLDFEGRKHVHSGGYGKFRLKMGSMYSLADVRRGDAEKGKLVHSGGDVRHRNAEDS